VDFKELKVPISRAGTCHEDVWGSRCTGSLIPNPVTGWISVYSLTLRSFYTREKTNSEPTSEEGGWDPGTVWKWWQKE
jgi:hypothetical protein